MEEIGGIVGEVEEISIAESSKSSVVGVGAAEEEEATVFGVQCCLVGSSGVRSEVGVYLSAVSTVVSTEDED